MKKTLLILAILSAPGLALADATSTFSLPDNFVANIWVQAQNIFNGTSGYVETIVGTILGLLVIGEVIHMLRTPNK